VNDNKSAVECFNQYFASVFTRDNLLPVSAVPMTTDKMEPVCIDVLLDLSTIVIAITKLTPEKAHCPDELTAKMLIETR